MNWLEKIFGKKEQESFDIRFEELTAWLGSGEQKLSVGGHAESIFSEINETLSRIKKRASELQNAEPEGRFHLKMVKIATTARDNMVKQVSLLIENINTPEKTDVKTVLEFHENSMQTLNMCLENMMKSYHYTKMVFVEESKNVITEVNELGRVLTRLAEPMNDNRNALNSFGKAQSAIKAINDLNSQIDGEKISLKEINEKIDTLKKKLELHQNSLAQLTDSEQWKQYSNLKNDIADFESEALKALADIDVILVPLKKPLLRLKQLNEDGKFEMAPGLKNELLLCLSDPKSADLGFFGKIGDLLRNDTAAFNPEKRDAILEQMNDAGAKLGTFQNEYRTSVSKINVRKNEISAMNIVREVANISSKISALQDDVAAAEKKIDESMKHLKSLEENAASKKEELQQIVSAIDKRKKVIF